MIDNIKAILELVKNHHPNSGLHISGKCESDLSGVNLLDDSTLSFNFDDVLAKKIELQKAEPMRILREQRNQKLAETDWWCCSDLNPTQEQLNYRNSLRDLPSNASPSLDDNGELTNVNWPEKPE